MIGLLCVVSKNIRISTNECADYLFKQLNWLLKKNLNVIVLKTQGQESSNIHLKMSEYIHLYSLKAQYFKHRSFLHNCFPLVLPPK